MKKIIYIPKGETCKFDILTSEKLVVNGKLSFLANSASCGMVARGEIKTVKTA